MASVNEFQVLFFFLLTSHYLLVVNIFLYIMSFLDLIQDSYCLKVFFFPTVQIYCYKMACQQKTIGAWN